MRQHRRWRRSARVRLFWITRAAHYLSRRFRPDSCRYYDYEWRLEQLRQIRRKQRAIAGKRSLADYGIIRRIHFIFDRATRKFKGDPGVWMTWLKFCKDSQSKRQVSKVITKALKLHPTASYFWAYAAAWCVSRTVYLAFIRCTTLCCMPAHQARGFTQVQH